VTCMAEGEAGFHNIKHTWQSDYNNGKLEPETPAAQPPKCPQCSSQQVWRDGLRYSRSNGEPVQRWLCRNCSTRFSKSSWNSSKNSERIQKGHRLILKRSSIIPYTRQVCELLTEESKNLTTVETQTQETAQREGTTPATDIKSKIVDFVWKLKREAYAETTIIGYAYSIQKLLRLGANLYDHETVKDILAKQENWSPTRKNQVIKAYLTFLKIHNLKADMPKYKVAQKLPFIPNEEEVDQLIAGCGQQMATFLQMLKETAARSGEAFLLKWTDVDTRNGTVNITPEKQSNPRVFKMSGKLTSMLNNLPKQSINIFTYKNKFYLQKAFMKQRKRIAHKLGNPRILQIHFHTFRHWRATMEYAKTKDILHVMQFLGHKNITNTLKYTQLVNFQSDDYVCKAAKTLTEATQFIEAGFEYVTEMENVKLFRKRK